MKTSKRLLSILLMLTMLVSMFTVMASAEAADETAEKKTQKVSVIIEGDGSVKVGNDTYTSNFDFNAEAGTKLVATPKSEDGTAKWYNGGGGYWSPITTTNGTFTFEEDYFDAIASLKVVFTNPESPVEDEPEEQTQKVSVIIEGKGSVKVGDTTYTKNFDFTAKAGTKLVATPESENGTAKWYNGGGELWHPIETTNGTFTFLKDYFDAIATLKVVFTNPEPVVTKYKLTLAKTEGGTIKCGNSSTEVELEKGKSATLTATPDDGYEFVRWHVVKGDAKFAEDTNPNTTVMLNNSDATVKAEFKKTTYTVTVKKGDNGTLKYTVNGKNEKTVTKATDTIENLKKDDVVKFTAKPKSSKYETVWKVNGNELTTHYNTLELTVGANDTVSVSFQKKLSSSTRWLYIDVSGWKYGDVEYRINDGKREELTTDDDYLPLEKGDSIKFYLGPNTNCTARWHLDNDAKSSSTTFTVRYKDVDEDDSTLYISFSKKGSTVEDDYPTLTFDITGGKHGTVYRGAREYEDGDVISIKKNDKMTFKAKTDKGYVAVWTYKGDTYVGDEYTVKMGANDAKLYVEFMDKDDIRLTELPFRDVSKRDWYYDDVVYVYRKGYMDGMSSTRFGGELNTTRGQIVTILWRLTGEPRATKRNPFTDVSSSQYYYDAISWAYDAGVVDGFDARTFKPDQNVTREQLAAILYRYAKYMNLSTSGSAYLAKYTDADKIANWAYDAMAWANYRGLINGTSATRIDPKGYATRAQIAAILHRFAVEYGA